MTELTAQRCEPCEGAVKPMGREEAERLMERLNEDWSLTEDGTEIHRDFFFKGFNKTMGFKGFWKSREEYLNNYPTLKKFRDHIYQERRSIKTKAYWSYKKQQKAKYQTAEDSNKDAYGG